MKPLARARWFAEYRMYTELFRRYSVRFNFARYIEVDSDESLKAAVEQLRSLWLSLEESENRGF